MRFDPLYHWAPGRRREAILREGLRPYSAPVVHGTGEDERFSFPYICLGVTPSAAWGLSGGTLAEDEFAEGWDLWQVRLAETADTHVLPFWGSLPQEVRVRNAVGADCVWYVATRQPTSARAA